MAKNNRLDTGSVFQTLLGKQDGNEAPEAQEVVKQTAAPEAPAQPVEPEKKEAAPVKAGRKANKEKNIQVSIYLTPDQAKTLRLQDAEKVKETDKSAIARTGLDIVLSLSNEQYLAMKNTAELKGVSAGEIVKEALEKYL